MNQHILENCIEIDRSEAERCECIHFIHILDIQTNMQGKEVLDGVRDYAH